MAELLEEERVASVAAAAASGALPVLLRYLDHPRPVELHEEDRTRQRQYAYLQKLRWRRPAERRGCCGCRSRCHGRHIIGFALSFSLLLKNTEADVAFVPFGGYRCSFFQFFLSGLLAVAAASYSIRYVVSELVSATSPYSQQLYSIRPDPIRLDEGGHGTRSNEGRIR